MTTFDNREKGFEARFAHDQELMFRVQNRRNKLLGLWTAELLGMTDAEADAYAHNLVCIAYQAARNHGVHDHQGVHDKVYQDLHARGIDMSDHRLQRKMTDLLDIARQQVMTEAVPEEIGPC